MRYCDGHEQRLFGFKSSKARWALLGLWLCSSCNCSGRQLWEKIVASLQLPSRQAALPRKQAPREELGSQLLYIEAGHLAWDSKEDPKDFFTRHPSHFFLREPNQQHLVLRLFRACSFSAFKPGISNRFLPVVYHECAYTPPETESKPSICIRLSWEKELVVVNHRSSGLRVVTRRRCRAPVSRWDQLRAGGGGGRRSKCALTIPKGLQQK